jgi:hypothetical protein
VALGQTYLQRQRKTAFDGQEIWLKERLRQHHGNGGRDPARKRGSVGAVAPRIDEGEDSDNRLAD